MQNNNRCKNTLLYIGFYLTVFLFLFVFLSVIHPVQIFDGDDWTYVSFVRNAVPYWGGWNPTRIFPEIFMPTVGFIAAYFVNPLLGNYLSSFTVTYAFVIALIVSIYISMFSRMISCLYRFKPIQELAVSLLFFVAHFWLFRSFGENNTHLFFAKNLTCYFYYTIPTLLCATLILYLETNPNVWNGCFGIKRGIFLLGLYLLIFSNMFSSIVLAAYAGVVTVQNVWTKSVKIRSTVRWKTIIKENRFYIGIVIVWMLSLPLEMSGGRAASLGPSTDPANIVSAAVQLLKSFGKINKIFLICALGVIFFAVIVSLKYAKNHEPRKEANMMLGRHFVRFSVTAALVTVYQVLLCGVASLPSNIADAEVLLSIFFFVLTALFSAAAYILDRIPQLNVFVPLIICIAVFNCHTFGKTYLDPYIRVQSSSTVRAVSEDIYSQVMAAYERGATSVEVKVPGFGGDNWPLPNYMGSRIERTLYEHGQIDRHMEIMVVSDIERNAVHRIE